jgi:hypothetical protein
MREAEVVGSNSGNAEKNRTRAYSHKKIVRTHVTCDGSAF